MTSYTGNGTTQAYAYDANGNRTSLSIGGASYTNTIAADSNRLLGTTGPVPANTNTYDLAGNLTNDATVTYTYTARGRMSSATVGTAKTSYLYNGLGQRVRQVTGTAANPAGLLVYDEAGHIIGEYNSATGKASKEFVYLGDTPVGVLEQVATGTAPNQAYATNVYFIYTDHIDTPRVITRSPDGQMVWRWDSGDPFGLLPPNDNPAGFGVFSFNLRMPGQYYDKSTNLFYNYFRDYDPQLGRYVQSDPIGLNGGLNTYGHVEANPISYIDPTGEIAILPIVIGIGIGYAFDYALERYQKEQCTCQGTLAGAAGNAAAGGAVGGSGRFASKPRGGIAGGGHSGAGTSSFSQMNHAAARSGMYSVATRIKITKVLRKLPYAGTALAAFEIYDAFTCD